MERIALPNGVTLSRIVYGAMRLGADADRSLAHIRAKVAACLDQGITTIDHADIYGGYTVEGEFGDALKGSGLRDQIEIVTKCGIVAPFGRYRAMPVKHYDTSRDHITASVEASLRLLQTDRIELLLIHRPDPFMDHAETGATLDGLVASGKVRAVGVSNFRPHDMAALQAAMKTPLATNQIELSLQATAPFSNGDLVDLQRLGLPPMAWSPLGGGQVMRDTGALGLLMDKMAKASGTDRAAVAVAWLLAHPARILPVMGTNSLARIATLSDAFRVPMDRVQWFRLYQAAIGHEVP